MKQKHLTFEERIIIEEYLNKGENVHKIALKLGRPDSSIVREIKRNRFMSASAKHEGCEKEFGLYLCSKHFSKQDCKYQIENGTTCHNNVCRGCNVMCNSNDCPDFVPHLCKIHKVSH